MKLLLSLVAAIFAMSIFHGVARAGGGSTELYSWKDNDGEWVYVLANGTNRQKTVQEIKKDRKQIKGTAALQKALALGGTTEEVLWSDHFLPGFEFPPEETRKEIEKAAKKAKIKLVIYLDSPIHPTMIEDKVSLKLGEEFSFEFKRDGDRLLQPSKVKAADAKKGSVHIKLSTTDASPFPPPRAGATRPYLSVDNNFDQTLSYRVLVRKKDPDNAHHKSFDKLTIDTISLPSGEAMNNCWAFDTLVEEVVLYDFKLSDKPVK